VTTNPNLTDTEREALIDAAYFRMLSAKNPEQRLAATEEMFALIKGRSAARVSEMEREQGLR